MFRKRSIEEFKIFYCWQSDIPGQREMIYEELQAQKYRLEELHHCHIEIDEDIRSVPGMIPIADTVLKKIREADVFVCDISPVTSIERRNGVVDGPNNYKRMPNSNVMLELGYALRSMHHSRIIALANTSGSKWYEGEMPFDIFDRYYIKFTCSEDLDLSRHLDLSIGFIKDYGRVGADGSILKGFFGRVWDKMRGEIPKFVPTPRSTFLKDNIPGYFSLRLSKAFPGVSSKCFMKEEAIKRLKVFFNDPVVLDHRMFAFVEEDGYSNPIDRFEILDDNRILLGQDIIDLFSLEVKRSSDVSEGESLHITGLQSEEVKYDDQFMDNDDYSSWDQYYSEYIDEDNCKHILSKRLHEDKAVFKKDGTWLSLDGKTQLRRIHLHEFKAEIEPRYFRDKETY